MLLPSSLGLDAYLDATLNRAYDNFYIFIFIFWYNCDIERNKVGKEKNMLAKCLVSGSMIHLGCLVECNQKLTLSLSPHL